MPAYLAGLLVFCALLVVGGIWGVRTFLLKEIAMSPSTTTVAPPPSVEEVPTVVTLRSEIPPSTVDTETPESLPTLALTPLPVSQILIPATTFQAGASEADLEFAAQLCAEYNLRDCRTPFEDELPRGLVDTPEADVYYLENREMTLSAFYIDLHEVTFAHYRVCVEAGVCSKPVTTGINPRRLYYDNPAYADYPVIYITWKDADIFCRWRGARLPTAWEWELAARGTDGRRFPWGNTRPARQTNYRTPEGTSATEEDTILRGGNIKPVGTYTDDRSPYGVMDMGGNVMEWVAGWYGTNMREIRGGSWNTAASTTRTTSRVHTDPRQPNQGYFDVGFRCAQDIEP
ncbi:MAG: Serine/threonine-protein kinase pkn1 [Chloroflexi bacterium ADurb.Bin360]|nr:MAG: Serine/threonine-protein kinase pkn1 [Chloroflexi bacterium ADurb.Bin360]